MTREEAIHELERVETWSNDLSDEEIEALVIALKALSRPDCEDAISRQAVLEYIEGSDAELGHGSENELVCQDIKEFPSVTPQLKTGRWIIKDGKEQGYDIGGVKTWYIQIMCSECGFIKTVIEGHMGQYNYCPNCGTRMQEVKEKMNIHSTREEFENLDCFMPTNEFNGIVIIPTKKLHDSGFGCMKFALLNYEEVVGCVGGYSDVIHLNGIGGYGKYNKNFDEVLKTNMVKRIDWSIDCLPNGLIRLFCSHKLDIDEFIVSDFNLYAK